MLYHLLYRFEELFQPFNVLKYITFRAVGATLTAILISFLFGGKLIAWLKSQQKSGQPIRTDGPESHLLTKVGTPTMGGSLILIALTVSTLLWSDLSNGYVWTVMIVTIGFGILGGIDDYLKLTLMNPKGMSGSMKLAGQLAISLVAAFFVVWIGEPMSATGLAFPFVKNFLVDLGWFYIPFAMVVMVGASNAVNLTDGLDGLAIVPVMIVALCYALIAYLVGHHVFANYLQINFIPGSGELAVFCGALVGASLGFLWFNAPPAMIFMGDTGSLALGGALGAISLITKHEIVLAIIGGLFVMETVSVIIQVSYFKATGKRVFLMAPIHHHFEKKGWKESTIVIRFWIVAVILALIGLSTLKLR